MRVSALSQLRSSVARPLVGIHALACYSGESSLRRAADGDIPVPQAADGQLEELTTKSMSRRSVATERNGSYLVLSHRVNKENLKTKVRFRSSSSSSSSSTVWRTTTRTSCGRTVRRVSSTWKTHALAFAFPPGHADHDTHSSRPANPSKRHFLTLIRARHQRTLPASVDDACHCLRQC